MFTFGPSKLIKSSLFLLLALSSAAVFVFDYFIAGSEIRIILPYLIIIFLAIWFIGNQTGFFFTIICLILWFISRTRSLSLMNWNTVLDLIIKSVFFSVQCVIFLRLKMLYREVRNLSLTDDLTGLNNRRGFGHIENMN